MKNDYPIGLIVRIAESQFKVCPAKNLNYPCDGCHFRMSPKHVCVAPENLLCSYPSRIFRPIKISTKNKNTFWRRLLAAHLWMKHFYNSANGTHYYNTKI